MASASAVIAGRTVRVGALAVVNASGAVVDPSTGLPWLAPPGLRRPIASERAALNEQVAMAGVGGPPPLNTTIGVVATDAELDRPEAGRLAMSAHDGLARAIRPAHSLVDGDTVIALSTATVPLPTARAGIVRSDGSRAQALNTVFALAAETFAVACADAVVNAMSTSAHRSHRDLCPSAHRAIP
jgi:L-aminopeptidase/D-esterase-like protein